MPSDTKSVNKVVKDGKVLIDLSNDTVDSKNLAKGVTAHDKSGKSIVGTGLLTDYNIWTGPIGSYNAINPRDDKTIYFITTL